MNILPFDNDDIFPVIACDAAQTSRGTWRLRSVMPCTCGERHEWQTSGPLSDAAFSSDCPERPFVVLHVVSTVPYPSRSFIDAMVAAISFRGATMMSAQHHSGLLRMQVGATGA